MARTAVTSNKNCLCERKDKLTSLFRAAGQEHVFQFYDTLPQTQQESLLKSLEGFDPTAACEILKAAKQALSANMTSNGGEVGERSSFCAPEELQWSDAAVGENAAKCCCSRSGACCVISRLCEVPAVIRAQWRRHGLELIGGGKVAVVVMAGGQGTRLGFAGPKGCLPAGPLSGKTLFGIFCERIGRLKQISRQQQQDWESEKCDPNNATSPSTTTSAGGGGSFCGRLSSLPLYVMTGEQNRLATESFFEENQFFGLPPADVMFFQQSMIPCFDNQGKFLLEEKYKLATNPNGNGGIFQALKDSGMLADMRTRGVEGVHVFGVDNLLCKTADPTFFGYCHSCNVEVGNKCVEKVNPAEKVGVFCSKMSNQPVIIKTTTTTQNETPQHNGGGYNTRSTVEGLSSSAPSSGTTTPTPPSERSTNDSVISSVATNNNSGVLSRLLPCCSGTSVMKSSVYPPAQQPHRVPCVVEYSEIPESLLSERKPHNKTITNGDKGIENSLNGTNEGGAVGHCSNGVVLPTETSSGNNHDGQHHSNGVVKESAGALVYGAANIANHYFSTAFITRLLESRSLNHMYHIAHKKIPHVNIATGETVTAAALSEPNGMKLELFVFDCFEVAERVVGLIVDRDEEFAPVKNPHGEDSLDTATKKMSALHQKWLEQQGGAQIETRGGKVGGAFVEIAGRVSYEGENMKNRFVGCNGCPLVIEMPYRLDFVADEIPGKSNIEERHDDK
eukprot:GHVS01058170.1.p1 GENE.GHVS01058170.1~~GHVS01058170.1.p1  ORF type:complete len:732 (+),score=170.52 GHVS01058170.1:80-2275(+)